MEVFLNKVWEVLTIYLDILIVQFQFDVWYLSQWWAWAFLGIPGVLWAVFMVFKWVLLTLPVSVLFGAVIRNPLGIVITPIMGWFNKKK